MLHAMRGYTLNITHKILDASTIWMRPRTPPIIVASIGRSGSTLLRDAIRESLAQSWRAVPVFVAHRLCSRGAFRPEGMRFKHGLVYKTHAPIGAFPLNTQLQMVFIYGPASDAALSVLAQDARLGRKWTKAHLRHLY